MTDRSQQVMTDRTHHLYGSDAPDSLLPSEATFSRSVLESIPGPTIVLDAAGLISMANLAWAEYVVASGADPANFGIGINYPDACDEAAGAGVNGAAEVAAGVRAVLARAQASFQIDYPASGRSDDRWFSMDVSPMRTDAGGAVVLHSDITKRKQYEEQLKHQALHDALTGLPNRALLSDRLTRALARGKRDGTGVGVLMLDLDHFKAVNDASGYAVGDDLLVSIALRLVTLVRPGDTVARLGGDQFVVLCEALGDPAEAGLVADRVIAGLALPLLQPNGHQATVTASIGVAVGAGTAYGDALLRDADAAMYHAKKQGRNRFAVFSAGLGGQARPLLTIEESLEQAIEHHEFRVFYQPIVDLRSGACVSMEALVRWAHPTRGMLAPDEFLNAAEETGLIVPIGEWVLRESCQQLARWRIVHPDAGPLTMSVNVSAKQMERPQFAQEVAAIISEACIAPHEIVLELTERTLMKSSVVPTAVSLHGLGVGLALDDFGIGYSALSRLKSLPVDRLKIDRAFVSSLGECAIDAAIVAAVVNMTRALGLVVVAEGVETEQQRDELVALGCEQAQGFLFAHPGPPEQIEALLWDLDSPMRPSSLAAVLL